MVMAYPGFWYQLLVIYHTIHDNSLHWNFDGANSNKKCTRNSLVLHQIDSGLSYFAFFMQRVGTYGLLIMTFGGWMVLVMAVPCVFILVGYFQNWFDFNSSQHYNNCWWIVILCILYAWHFYILDLDTNFWLCIIPFMAIPCIGIVMVQISKKNVLGSIKLIADCHILHSICTELAYMDYW
jgi:hypothetical protein